jgi:hypothetical protein
LLQKTLHGPLLRAVSPLPVCSLQRLLLLLLRLLREL